MTIKEKTDGRGRKRFAVYVYDAVHRKTIYLATFDRRKDAMEAEYEGKRRLKLGEPVKPKPPREEVTFDTLSARWHNGLVSVRPSTRKDYDSAIRRLKPLIGSKPVSLITRRDIDEVIATLAVRYAPSTVRKTIVVMKMILRMGVEHGNLDRMPTGGSRLSLPRLKRRVFEPLAPQQVKKLIACTTEFYRPFVQLLLTSGLRGSEARGLRVQDLDLDAGVIHVRGQLIKGRIVDLKTDASYRDVPLPHQTLESLRAHLTTLPASDLGLLFPTPEGKPITASNFYARVWIPAREKAGLPSLRLHDCRHQLASVLLAQGRSITYVQRLLGHSNPSTLLSIYSWVTKDEADVATAEFEKWLGEEERSLYMANPAVGVISGSSARQCQTLAA